MIKNYSLVFIAFLCFATSINGQTEIFNVAGGGSFLTGWSATNNIATNDIDRGSYYLVDAGNPSDIITTAIYDLSAYSFAEFSLDVASFGSNNHNEALIEISFNGGSTFTQTELSTTTTGSSYIDGGTFTLNSVTNQVQIRISNNGTSGRGVRLRNLVLTAFGIAGPTTYSVTYNGNGNTGGATPTDGNAYNSGDTVTILGNTGPLVNTCNTFDGWNTASDGSGTSYVASDTFNITANTILYAQWLPTGNTVTFNSNSGTGTMSPQTNCSATNLTANTFINTGFTFNSWNTASDGSGTSYADGASYSFASDITLYAQWDVFVGPCGSETFTIPTLPTSYSDGNFTGDNGVIWTFEESRNDDSYEINGEGIMLRDNTSKLTSSSISGGIESFTCKLKKAYTGSGNRQVELFINGVSQGTSVAWDNTTVQTFTVTGIYISGNVIVEIRNISSKQLIIDDIEWTCYSATPKPEIEIQGNGTEIADGDTTPDTADDTDFGNVTVVGGTNANVFTIYNTGTADLDITSITSSNNTEFAVSGTTLGIITPSNSVTFTITFDPNATGSRTSIITIISDDANESTYTFDIIGNGTNSNQSTIIDNTTYSTTTPEFNSNVEYINFINGTATATGKFIPMKLKILDGPDADGFDTKLTDISFTVEDMSNTNQLAMIKTAILTTTGGTPLATASKVGNELVFSGMNSASLTAADDDTDGQIFHLRVSIDETQVIDNTKLVFKVTSATADASGSSFAAADAGGAETDTGNNDRNRLNVTADRLAFTVQPSSTSVSVNMAPAPVVSLTDLYGNTDLDINTGSITMTSTGTPNAQPAATISNGQAVFNSVNHTVVGGPYNLTASYIGWSIISDPFNISDVVNGSYRTTSNGTWHSTNGSGTATWEQFTGTWISMANQPPTNTSNPVFIRHDITLVGTNSAADVTIENGGILRTSTVSATFTEFLVKSGGVFKKEANGIKMNGTLEVENGGTVTFKHTNGTSRTTNFWNGIEKFHEDSNFIIETTDNTSNFLVIETNAEVSEYNGGCFGNVIVDISTGKLQLLPNGFNKTLTKGDLIFRNNTDNVKFSGGTFSTTIKGDLIIESTHSRNLTILQNVGTAVLNVEGDVLHEGSGDFRLANCQSPNNGEVTLNVDGDIMVIDAALKMDIGSSANSVATINLKGDILIDEGGFLNNNNANATVNFNFTGIGDGSTSALTQTIDIASTSTDENNLIDFNVLNGAYVQLSGQDFELGTNSALNVLSGATLDFGFNGTTALNVGISGSQTGTVFTSQTGSTLKITSPEGISNVGYTSNVRTAAYLRSFNQTATFHYIGKENQVTGNGLTTLSSGKIIICDLIDNNTQLTLSNSTSINNSTTINPLGGALDIRVGQFIETPTAYIIGSTGRLIMQDGTLYQIPVLSANSLDLIPRLNNTTIPYDLNGSSTIQLNGAGNQILRGQKDYKNLTFSTSGTKDISSSILDISGTILIEDTARLNIQYGETMGGSGTNLTMTDNSEYFTASTSSGGIEPAAQGTYNLEDNSKIIFAHNIANGITLQTLKLTKTYNNIDIIGDHVGIFPPLASTSIKFNGTYNPTFTVKPTGIFKFNNTSGFSGGTTTAIDNTNNPNIILDTGSTVEYAGDNQTLTELLPHYSNLNISGTGTKQMGANDGIIIGEDLNVIASELYIDNSKFVQVEDNAVIASAIKVETKGAFVQVDDAGTFNLSGSGTATANKVSASKNTLLDYTYWSSPITAANLNTLFSAVPVNRRYEYNAANYRDEFMEALNDNTQTLGQDDIDDNGDDWQLATGIMTPGQGYAFTGPTFVGGFPYVDDIDFTGEFNTGDITIPIYENGFAPDNDWNLIGNPYPSALDFSAFHTQNNSLVEGVAYLWSHYSALDNTNNGNEGYNFNQDDYAIINVGSGGTAGSSGIIPQSYIPSGQSFFIVGTATGNAVFKNAMRKADGTSNNQFFRSNEPQNEANKLWLNLTSDNGIFNQVLIAYVHGATDNFDSYAYDAPRNLSSGTAAIIYTKIEDSPNKNFAIQGKHPNSLTLDEVIPLGFYTSIDVPTIYTFSIAQFEGEFMTSNPIYVLDKLKNITHNLKDSDYTFTSETGEFNDRFEIVFTPTTLSIDDNIMDANEITITELQNGDVQISVGNTHTIKHVAIMDVNGRIVYSLQGNDAIEVYDLSKLSQAAYIAKITLSNGQVISKKAIKQH